MASKYCAVGRKTKIGLKGTALKMKKKRRVAIFLFAENIHFHSNSILVSHFHDFTGEVMSIPALIWR